MYMYMYKKVCMINNYKEHVEKPIIALCIPAIANTVLHRYNQTYIAQVLIQCSVLLQLCM